MQNFKIVLFITFKPYFKMSFVLGNNKLSLAEMRKIYAKSGCKYSDDELLKMRDWLDNLADIALAIVEHNGVDNMNEIIDRANRSNDNAT